MTKDNSWTEWRASDLAAVLKKGGEAADRLRKHASAPFSKDGAGARVLFARARAMMGDMRALHWALGPYLQSPGGEWTLNEEAISHVSSRRLEADICALASHLMLYRRDYVTAIHLLERAVSIYEAERDYAAEAEAYYWTAYIRLHQSDYHEAERCESKSIELIYKGIIQDKPGLPQPDELSLSQAIARARIGLGLLAHRQGLLTKAKAELYTARELLHGTRSQISQKRYPRIWGDLYATLGRVHSSEGNYESAVAQLSKALDFYVQAEHVLFATQTRIHMARAHIKDIARSVSIRANQDRARFHLETARRELSKKVSGGDLRTECLLDLTYSWYSFACGDWKASERLAGEAVRSARRLGSRYLMAESYRARADAAIQAGKLAQARTDLAVALEYAQACSNRKIIGAVILSYARSYCTEVEPSQIEVDKHLDRFLELKAKSPFESHYLEYLFETIKVARSAMPSDRAFYFSGDELLSMGYDAGLLRFQSWAIRFAENCAHGDVKEMSRLLHFNSLGRTYNYIKVVRAKKQNSPDRTGSRKKGLAPHEASRD